VTMDSFNVSVLSIGANEPPCAACGFLQILGLSVFPSRVLRPMETNKPPHINEFRHQTPAMAQTNKSRQ
jgi:hypothetical protein